MGPAAGLRLGPQVPEAAPSSSPTWPRACTVETEPARARRVRGWRDEAVERLRGGGQNEIIPARAQPASERHPTQRRPSAITARPQVRRAADICARSGGPGLGHGGRGVCNSTFVYMCAIQVRPAARWLSTCRWPVAVFPWVGRDFPRSNEECASPLRSREARIDPEGTGGLVSSLLNERER